MKDNKHGYELPEIVSPDTVSFCIEVPDEPFHLRAFWGALLTLTHAYNWGNDEAHTAKDVADVWRSLWLKNHKNWRERACTETDNCASFRPTSPHLTWFPENPYTPNDVPPDGYTYHPWTVVTGSILDQIISIFGLGFKVGDVFTDLTKFPLFAGWDDIFTDYAGLPYIKLTGFSGVGTVELSLLNIYQGGRVLLFKDGYISLNPLEWQSVELNKDKISFPPENETQVIIEVEFDTGGEHYLDIVFAPVVDDALIPLFFGAGIRSFELCGFGREGCGMSEECCDELSSNQQTTNALLQQMLDLIGGGFKIVPINGITTPPDEAGGDCAPDYFDHDTGESEPEDILQREKALCLTVYQYVKAILIKVLRDMNSPQALIDYVDGLFPDVTVPLTLTNLTVYYPNPLFSLSIFFNAVANDIDITAVACSMLNGLTGDKNNTASNFRDSLLNVDLGEELQDFVRIVHGSNANSQNYKDFNTTLNANNGADLSTFDCPCDILECGEPLDLVIVASADTAGSTITPLGADLYRFEQNTIAAGGKYITAIRDSGGRCLLVEPQGEDTQDPFAWDIQDCDGVWHSGISSFAPVETKEFAWQNTDPMNTVYKVTCVE